VGHRAFFVKFDVWERWITRIGGAGTPALTFPCLQWHFNHCVHITRDLFAIARPKFLVCYIGVHFALTQSRDRPRLVLPLRRCRHADFRIYCNVRVVRRPTSLCPTIITDAVQTCPMISDCSAASNGHQLSSLTKTELTASWREPCDRMYSVGYSWAQRGWSVKNSLISAFMIVSR